MSIVSDIELDLKTKKETIEILSKIKKMCLEEKIETLMKIYSEKRICELLNNFTMEKINDLNEKIEENEKYLNGLKKIKYYLTFIFKSIILVR